MKNYSLNPVNTADREEIAEAYSTHSKPAEPLEWWREGDDGIQDVPKWAWLSCLGCGAVIIVIEGDSVATCSDCGKLHTSDPR